MFSTNAQKDQIKALYTTLDMMTREKPLAMSEACPDIATENLAYFEMSESDPVLEFDGGRTNDNPSFAPTQKQSILTQIKADHFSQPLPVKKEKAEPESEDNLTNKQSILSKNKRRRSTVKDERLI